MMKTYKSSDLTQKRTEVLSEASKNGVIIQQLETNGKVRREFVLTQFKRFTSAEALMEHINHG